MLTREPNRYRTLAGAAKSAEKAGDRAKSIRYSEQLVELTRDADTPRPEVAEANRIQEN